MYNLISQFVREDLSEYNERNRPLSKTVVNGDLWRHYELGSIYGFVVYNGEYVEGQEVIRIASIMEDDGSWFDPEESMNMPVYWLNDIFATLNRAKIWHDHIKEGMKIEPQTVIPKFKPNQHCQIDSNSTSDNKYYYPWSEWYSDDIVILDYCEDFFKKQWYICKNLTKNKRTVIPEDILKLKK